MKKSMFRFVLSLALVFPVMAIAAEISGTGSMIAGPLIRVWHDAYAIRTPTSVVNYKGSNPADGIKRLKAKEVDFSGIDMPLSNADLKKDGLMQFPFALGGIAPVVNLPNVFRGQFKLNGKALGDIYLGHIKNWNDPVLVALNPNLNLPDAGIIVIHRVSPPGISTIIGNYLAKVHPEWKTIKGDGMAGVWPDKSIEVKNPIEYVAMIKKTEYSIGYLPVPQIMKNGLVYAQMQTTAGTYISPSDENISAAATNAKWEENEGFDVVLTNQPGANSWPMSFASFVLVRKVSEQPEHSKEFLKYLKYSLRNGGLKAIQYDYIPLPDTVREIVTASFSSVVDDKGVSVLKH